MTRCLLETLGGVDLIHAGLDPGIGGEIRHEGVEDFVSVFLHDEFELFHGGGCNVSFGGEGFVEFHAGDGGAYDVEYVGLDLASGIGEAVVGVIGVFL